MFTLDCAVGPVGLLSVAGVSLVVGVDALVGPVVVVGPRDVAKDLSECVGADDGDRDEVSVVLEEEPPCQVSPRERHYLKISYYKWISRECYRLPCG